jgi:hypothetical protein
VIVSKKNSKRYYIDFYKYNPEYALVMVEEIMKMVNYTKDNLTPPPDGHEIICGD